MESAEPGVVVPRPSLEFELSQKRLEDVAIAEEPLPKRRRPLSSEDQPVPPYGTVSAEVRESDDAEREPVTESVPALWAEVAPHCSATPYILITLLLAVMMRYFIDVPAGCEERLTAVSPYKVVPSSRFASAISVVVAHEVPPSRETAAARSVFNVKEAEDFAANRSLATAGEVEAVKVEERRVMLVGVGV